MAKIPIWPGSSSFNSLLEPTPFGFYDSDKDFREDADKVASYIVKRLGYPLIDIELQETNLYACFEEAVTEYGGQVYNFQIINDIGRLLGSSTNNITLPVQRRDFQTGTEIQKHIYCKPLLNSLPKLNESIDLVKHKYKINSVTLDLNNVEYSGKRISDEFSTISLNNGFVSIYYVSQSANVIKPHYFTIPTPYFDADEQSEWEDWNGDEDLLAFKVYSGIIRDYTHTAEKVKLKIEDLSAQKMVKELPATKLGNEVLEDYRGQYLPMTYGWHTQAVTVRSDLETLNVDDKYIWGFQSDTWQGTQMDGSNYNSKTGALKIFEQGKYVNVVQEVYHFFELKKYGVS